MGMTMWQGSVFWKALVAWALLAQMASANCTLLLQAMDLATQSFAAQSSAADADYDRLHLTITMLKNDEVLRALQASGQAHTFGSLRNFLTQMKFVAQSPNPSTFEYTDRMARDFETSQEVISAACSGIGSQTGSTGAQDPANAAESDGLAGIRSATGQARSTISEADAMRMISQDMKVDKLAGFLSLFVVIAAFCISLYYCWRFARLWYRNRRICDVPATLIYILTEVPGRIRIIGRMGCRFEPSEKVDVDLLEQMTAGTFCTLKVQDKELNSQLILSLTKGLAMLFVTQLSRDEVNAMTAGSKVPSRLDLSALKGPMHNPPAPSVDTGRPNTAG